MLLGRGWKHCGKDLTMPAIPKTKMVPGRLAEKPVTLL